MVFTIEEPSAGPHTLVATLTDNCNGANQQNNRAEVSIDVPNVIAQCTNLRLPQVGLDSPANWYTDTDGVIRLPLINNGPLTAT